MVPPLFDEMMNSVVLGSISASIARTRTGESESMVRNLIRVESGLLYFVIVIGAWVEPPWPMRTTVLSPDAMISSANAWIFSSGYGGLLARSVQPMKVSAQACASSEKSYTEASLAWMRLAMQSFTSVLAEGYSFSVSLVSILPS